jgi:anti-anti-sigma regulatory factor
MLNTELDKSKNLLHVVLSQHVTAEEIGRWREQVGELLPGLQPEFKILVDWSGVDSMDLDCVPEIDWCMEAVDQAGVSKIVRIVPDPRKDIGVNIIR